MCCPAHLHHCITPTFLVSPSHIHVLPGLSYLHRCTTPTFHVSPSHDPRVILPQSTCHPPTINVSPSHNQRVARLTFIIVPRPPSTCHPPTIHVSPVTVIDSIDPLHMTNPRSCENYNSHIIKMTYACLLHLNCR